MTVNQKKEQQKKRLAKQLRTNLMRRKAQARERTNDSDNNELLDEVGQIKHNNDVSVQNVHEDKV